MQFKIIQWRLFENMYLLAFLGNMVTIMNTIYVALV